MRTLATIGDVYGPDAGASFYNANNGSMAGPQGTALGAQGGGAIDQAAGATGASINPVSVGGGLRGTIWANGVFQWFLIASVVIAVYALAKRHVGNLESEVGTPRVSIPSFLSIGAQAFLFLVLVKTLLKKYNVPGLSGMAANA